MGREVWGAWSGSGRGDSACNKGKGGAQKGGNVGRMGACTGGAQKGGNVGRMGACTGGVQKGGNVGRMGACTGGAQ